MSSSLASRTSSLITPFRLMARTPVFQAEKRGSKPLRVTMYAPINSSERGGTAPVRAKRIGVPYAASSGLGTGVLSPMISVRIRMAVPNGDVVITVSTMHLQCVREGSIPSVSTNYAVLAKSG